MSADPQKVFVIHGRNDGARKSMFAFLRAIGLRPIEWSEAMAATEKGSPYIGEVLDKAFEMAQAVVVLVTPDDIAHLRREYAASDDDPEITPGGQARPNVLFEAGMAFGRNADRTIMVELGSLRPFSDVAGRHAVRLTNAPEKRIDLASRLKTAGCAVDTGGTDWLSEGDFASPEPVGTALPKGRRLTAAEVVSAAGPRLDAKYFKRSSGSDRIQLINRTSKAILGIEALNAGDFRGVLDGFPVEKIPAYKSVSLQVIRTMGTGNTFELKVRAKTEDNIDFEEDLFLDLNG